MKPTLAYVMSNAPWVMREYSSAVVSRSNSSGLITIGAFRRVGIDARNFAVGFVRAHVAVDALHLRHHRVDRLVRRQPIVRPQLDDDPRPHDAVVGAVEPFGVRGAGAMRPTAVQTNPNFESQHRVLFRKTI